MTIFRMSVLVQVYRHLSVNNEYILPTLVLHLSSLISSYAHPVNNPSKILGQGNCNDLTSVTPRHLSHVNSAGSTLLSLHISTTDFIAFPKSLPL